MKTQAGGLIAALAAVLLSSCSLGQALGAESSPSSPQASAAASPAQVTDYNARYGNNRVAAEAAIKVGRVLYAQQQYWEVYIKTDPPQLAGAYDATRPDSFDAAAKEVRQVDLILATESGASIRAYAGHETAVLTDVGKALEALFPRSTQVSMRVFYGEGNLHATATMAGGRLDYHAGPSR